MKYLKRFNEAVIRPYDFDQALNVLKKENNHTVESINKLFEEYGVKFVDVDYFKSKLQTKKEIELVPVNMPEMPGGIRFAAHNIYNNMMYVCINEAKFISVINSKYKREVLDLLREILRHESIHKQQGEKRDVVIRNLENSPMKPKEYFGSTDETMAYAQSFIDQCQQRGMTNQQILDALKSGRKVSWVQDVYSKLVDDNAKRKFNKYVYQYLQKDEE
jgi:hypothetical protein